LCFEAGNEYQMNGLRTNDELLYLCKKKRPGVKKPRKEKHGKKQIVCMEG